MKSLSLVVALSGAKPLVPFGKGNRSSQEGGNTGRRTMRSCRPLRDGRPFSSRPGSSGSAGYSGIFRAGKPRNRGVQAAGRIFSSMAWIMSARRTAIMAPSRMLTGSAWLGSRCSRCNVASNCSRVRASRICLKRGSPRDRTMSASEMSSIAAAIVARNSCPKVPNRRTFQPALTGRPAILA